MTQDEFVSQLAKLLRYLPRATSADLTDDVVAYWDGHAVVFAFLGDCASGEIDEEFDLDNYAWEEWRPAFERWCREPVFSVRPQLRERLNDAPPHEAGA